MPTAKPEAQPRKRKRWMVSECVECGAEIIHPEDCPVCRGGHEFDGSCDEGSCKCPTSKTKEVKE